MLITNTGVLIRTRVSEIREMGRATQGVTLISLDDGTKLSGLQHIAEAEVAVELDADLEGEAGEANDAGEPTASAAADESTDATDAGDTPDDTSEGDEDSTS
jgi:DNA gyrase subunit A